MTITYGEYGRQGAIAANLSNITSGDAQPTAAPVTLHLNANVLMSLTPPKQGGRGMKIACVSGKIWVTQQGDPTDYLLEASQIFKATLPGKVVVQAMAQEAMVSISES